ncbi:hypothetical protein SAMN04487765_0564 [Tenacibaculum sp. MAR_2010_89]|uniref:hypothetical protein n=1 Tax=Tenacibaculum sp. MAR_2010_89 TaxID=1250198 RepID=UPI000897ED6D|nr:hypothetical protein [Tenacibaculum sp. MAR_2010_89]SED63425.1 hypothetical protein SAMN04487765_0564 [Tenacibaculum sp. MAR_2010_89]
MKKSNFITKTLILLVAIVICSFTTKKTLFNNVTKNSIINFVEEKKEILPSGGVLIVYNEGTTEQEKKTITNCIGKSDLLSIKAIIKCAENPNAEIIYFQRGFSIFTQGDDTTTDGDDQPQLGINPQDVFNAISNCSNGKVLLYSLNLNCSDSQTLSGSLAPNPGR